MSLTVANLSATAIVGVAAIAGSVRLHLAPAAKRYGDSDASPESVDRLRCQVPTRE